MSLTSQTESPQARSALHDPQRRGRIIIGALNLLISAGYLWQALIMPQGDAGQPGPGLWPSAVGAAWVVISLIVILEAMLTAQVGGDSEFPVGKQRRDVILFYIVTVVFVVLIPILGMYLASILYVGALLKLTSELPWWKVGVFGTLIGFSIPWAFITLLQLRLPLGFVGDLF